MPDDLDARRFLRDLDLPGTPDGVAPLTTSGDLRAIEGRPNLHKALRRRLVCSPGTLVHRQEYGAGYLDEVERLSSPSRRADIAVRGRRNLLRDPRVDEVGIAVSADGPTVTAKITITAAGESSDEAVAVELGG